MGGTPDKKFHSIFWTEISRFIYQSRQFLTEIINLILFSLKNVIKKARIRRLWPNGLISWNFAFFITFFNKNDIKLIISVKNCLDWYINRNISVQKMLWKFLSGVPPRIPLGFCAKIFFLREKYTNDMSIDAVFDGDYEFAIIFSGNIYMKNENRKIRVHFGM